MKCSPKLFVVLAVFLINSCTHLTPQGTPRGSFRNPSSIPLNQPWSYDDGPDLATPMGRELVDIVAQQPNMPSISYEMTGEQKFRPAFGPTLWRMIQKPNSLKILFIGQDGTHIAEAAGRTATAGFGGRAQDMAAHFGVNTSSGYMNAFAFTIKGQYSGFGAPVISEENGAARLNFETVVDNGVWLMAQDQNSPMVKWRNKLIDWIMRNNKDSLRMVVLFGDASQDAIATFIESRGGKVGSRYSADQIEKRKIQVPLFDPVNSGGNSVTPVALTTDGRNVYEKLGYAIPYTDLSLQIPFTKCMTPKELATFDCVSKKKLEVRKAAAQAKLLAAKTYLTNNITQIRGTLATASGGMHRSGVIHPAQIGGYDLKQIYVNGQKTISLKNLSLTDGSVIKNDVLVAEFPHPSSLSMNLNTAVQRVENSLEALKPMREKGWVIEPDSGLENRFAKGLPYNYGRTDITVDFYDFGTPKNRMVSVSSASRMSGMANVIVIGTRERATFTANGKDVLMEATIVGRPAGISEDELFTARPRTLKDRYVFDAGPGEKMARIMKQNIDMGVIGKIKPGYKLKSGVKKKTGQALEEVADVDAFNVKTHPLDVGDFGHYRGTFVDPQVVILADPDGMDEILTSRALTGTRGQYLQSLMNQMGVNDKYLVLRTVPFGMDGATESEWKTVLAQTTEYRQRIFDELRKLSSVKMVVADGAYAGSEIQKLGIQHVPVINIKRTGTENNSGINEAIIGINKLDLFKTATEVQEMSNIPRSHLGFFSRVWEGTSGTRVFGATSPADRGIAFAIVAPEWSYRQKFVSQTEDEKRDVKALKQTYFEQKLPLPNESFETYLKRVETM